MVDGYDETFDQLWGREDSDLCYRLFHSGVKVKNLWFSALQYHLHHKVIKRTGEDRLDKELRLILDEKRKKALKGFSQLSSEGRIVASSAGSRS
jgi:argonaute-like protein implicated in RNA metabolism and viral defense